MLFIMEINIDLHSHSGASGGVGDISLAQVAETCRWKGIHVFGTGDALHDGWLDSMEQMLLPAEEGLYRLDAPGEETRFLVQSEIIITSEVPSGGRKGVHTILLFPSFGAARETARLLDRWGAKRKIGRPFLTCSRAEEVAERLAAIASVDAGIEIIPAHVLTPQGIFGSDHPVDRLEDFFGEAERLIRVVETGLSADPQVLALIPELDERALVSNSDCHSGALNRVGREYTTIEANCLSYSEIIQAIRYRKIVRTAEFTPAEGRYFLTGHRAGKKGHKDGSFCYFSPDTAPADGICPICGKPLTVGVLQRALYLSAAQGEARDLQSVAPSQCFFQMIPLVEVIAKALGIKSISSKKVTAYYRTIIDTAGTEADFWNGDNTQVGKWLRKAGAEDILEAIMQVRSGNYTFEPLGYDGLYGELVLGRKGSWFGNRQIQTCNQNC
jgi:PHP family Zn ribbon phosphoesterase